MWMFIRCALVASLCAVLGSATALAQTTKTYTKTGSFDDVRFELSNAIIAKGLVVDHNGKVGDMLARTGADVGSTKPIYKNAEYFTFCSAKLSRDMMEVNPGNLAHCPYVMFAYELAGKPGQIVIGYRRLPEGDELSSRAAFTAINGLLDQIAKAAIK